MVKLNSESVVFLGLLGISFVLAQQSSSSTTKVPITSTPATTSSNPPTTSSTASPTTTTIASSTVASSTVASSTIASTTPFPDEGYNCTEKGAFPHPIYCEYYYDCTGGVDTLIKCQPNLLFSLRYFGCDWPEDTDCGNRTRPEGYPGTVTPPAGSTTTPLPGSFECPPEAGKYPDPEDCRSYYSCINGVAYHYSCGQQLRYKIETEECDWPINVDCGDRPLPTP